MLGYLRETLTSFLVEVHEAKTDTAVCAYETGANSLLTWYKESRVKTFRQVLPIRLKLNNEHIIIIKNIYISMNNTNSITQANGLIFVSFLGGITAEE